MTKKKAGTKEKAKKAKKAAVPRGMKNPKDEPPKDSDFPLMILANGAWSTLRPPEGGEFGLNFGPFLVVVTNDGAALVLTSPMRKEVALAAVENGGKDRLICVWPDKSGAPAIEREAGYAKVLTASLGWMPKENVP